MEIFSDEWYEAHPYYENPKEALTPPPSSASPACSTPYLLALKPAYAATRGMFSRPGHKGYTNSLDEAGRFTEADALQAQQDMPDKYVAIPVKA